MGFLKRLFGGGKQPGDPFAPAGQGAGGLSLQELARRLGIAADELRAVRVGYTTFPMPKRSGKPRQISAPDAELKRVQRLILRRVLGRLKAHPAATAFERGHSIVTNAQHHVGQEVVVRLDMVEFFASTPADRVRGYFRRIGWDAEAADRLTDLCTHRRALPQGAPTSPRLSNLVNWELDCRLQKLADKLEARYTRYADDITFSFGVFDRQRLRALLGSARLAIEDCGYEMHMKRKLNIRRRHDRQKVTGLVVNDRVNLPREVRRRLRAIEHRASFAAGLGGPAPTLTESQLRGWRALAHMIEVQREAPE